MIGAPLRGGFKALANAALFAGRVGVRKGEVNGVGKNDALTFP